MPLGSSSAAPVMTPGPRRLIREPLPLFFSPALSATEAVDDGIAPLLADEPRRYLHARRGLATFVFGAFEQTPDAIDGCVIEALFRQLVGREIALDQPAQDRVEHGIRRQRVLVFLVGPQFGRRRLGDDALGNDHALVTHRTVR